MGCASLVRNSLKLPCTALALPPALPPALPLLLLMLLLLLCSVVEEASACISFSSVGSQEATRWQFFSTSQPPGRVARTATETWEGQYSCLVSAN